MQRLIEQPADDGDMFDGPLKLGHVHYHLAVYRHFSDVENESVPAHLEIEGRLFPVDSLELAPFHGSELTLRLADGRSLDFSFTDGEGRIRSTGRGLYRA